MGAALQGDLSNTAHRLPDPQAVQSWKHGEARATVTVVEHSVERSFHTYAATAFTPLRNVKSGAGHQSSAKCMSRFVFIECVNDGVLALARNVSVPICTRIGRSVAYWEWFLVCLFFSVAQTVHCPSLTVRCVLFFCLCLCRVSRWQ